MRHRLSLSASLALLSAWLGLPAPAAAQVDPAPATARTIVASHDFDSASNTYCVLGNKVDGVGGISATASATITSAVTGALTNVVAGAELTVDRAGQLGGPFVAYVNTPGASTVVVNDAVTIAAGTSWSFRNLECSTTGGGWFGVSQFEDVTFALQTTVLEHTGNSTARIECRHASPWSLGVQVYPTGTGTACLTGTFATTDDGLTCYIPLLGLWNQCRFGYAVAVDDGADNTAGTRERVTLTLMGR